MTEKSWFDSLTGFFRVSIPGAGRAQSAVQRIPESVPRGIMGWGIVNLVVGPFELRTVLLANSVLRIPILRSGIESLGRGARHFLLCTPGVHCSFPTNTRF